MMLLQVMWGDVGSGHVGWFWFRSCGVMLVQVMWSSDDSGHVGVMMVQLMSCGVILVQVMWSNDSGHVG